ncbi:MAG: hypothetical protein HY429_02025 [Candidatus Levybacteria bacterium]|nr:hypothetical protein [Candidatus Levybacteria bacterium]
MRKQLKLGISVVEVILAVAIFMTFATGAIVVVLQGYGSNVLGAQETIASQFASEGIEAVKSIKNQGFTNLSTCGVNCATGTGITKTGGVWVFSGVNNSLTSGKTYTRTIKVEDVQRDAAPPNGNIVAVGGTVDPDSKKVTSTVTWNASPSRSNTITLISYLSYWEKPIAAKKNGMLLYGDGGTTSDAVMYRLLSGETGAWSSPQTIDFDTGASDKALRAIRLYASATRNEKIAISKHYNGATQYIYAHVFDGSSWTSTLLSSWNSGTFLDVRNFDGTYLADGRFMAVYSDNTTTPKYKTWDATAWSSQANTTNVGGIPNYIIAKARPGTNEAMMAVFDQSNDTNTAYFNVASWSSPTEHATGAPTNSTEHIDFTWSAQNSAKGALVYAAASPDRTINLRIWTANGTGGGNWTATIDSPQATGRLGAVNIDGRKGAEEFVSCVEDGSADITCFQSNTSPAWTTPANNILAVDTDPGRARSFDFRYEAATGTEGIAVYSEPNRSIPKLRRYNATTNAFEAQALELPSVNATMQTVRMRSLEESDDIMILMANNARDVYSVVWDGTNNQIYTDESGRAFTLQGTNGSDGLDFWYDFAWDKF